MIRKDWTLAEAERAQEAAVKKRGTGRVRPDDLLFQWAALHWLDALEKEYNRGRQSIYLFHAIGLCASHSVLLPRWAADAFRHGFWKVERAHARSWDAAFGAPLPKGAKLPALRRKQLFSWSVYFRVRELNQANTPIDDGMFEVVAREVGIGKRACKEYYYLHAPPRLGRKAKRAAPR
jgi:hypothetical protein